MPEVRFRVRWPDGSQQFCYSPSRVIKEYFISGQPYEVADFLDRTRRALEIASERVRQKYGYSCGQAAAQLAVIEHTAARFRAGGHVTVEAFEE